MRKFIIALSLSALILPASAQERLLGETAAMSASRKLGYAEQIIERYYLEDVDADKLAEEAIKAMLLTLDPHSSYSDPEETTELTTNLGGNFSGIGVQFSMVNDTLVIIQPTSGGPSESVGILPGDRILRADNEVISGAGKSNADIIRVLRGPKGTPVNLTVERRGVDRPLQFRVVRNDIPLNSIDAAYMADPTTGYIRLSRFAETSDQEFTDALKKLRKEGMKNLIIDLTDNGGGYLQSAGQLASHFLQKGDTITYTSSPKMGTNVLAATKKGDFTDGRVVVMVNQYSASASEILSGAMQDNDRGLIVGRRTFGKGLVQRPFPFPDGSMIKLTVSRYYTPSGRSIQKPYELGHSDDYQKDILHRYENGEFIDPSGFHFPDSLKFSTRYNHRTVYGGGGIMPDLFVPIDTVAYTDYYRDLVAKGIPNAYALSYANDNRSDLLSHYPTEKAFLDDFEVTPEMLDGVIAAGKKDGVEYNAEQWHLSRQMVRTVIKGLIGRSLYDSTTYYKAVNPSLNPIYQAALELINDPERYNSLLNP